MSEPKNVLLEKISARSGDIRHLGSGNFTSVDSFHPSARLGRRGARLRGKKHRSSVPGSEQWPMKNARHGVLAAEPNDETAPWAVSHFHGVAKRHYVYTHNTGQRPANNRTLEYTNSHSIRRVDRGSYRNLLCSREVATDGG